MFSRCSVVVVLARYIYAKTRKHRLLLVLRDLFILKLLPGWSREKCLCVDL